QRPCRRARDVLSRVRWRLAADARWTTSHLAPRRQMKVPGGIFLGAGLGLEAVALRQRLTDALAQLRVGALLDASLVDVTVRAPPGEWLAYRHRRPAPARAHRRRHVELAVDDDVPHAQRPRPLRPDLELDHLLGIELGPLRM